MVQPKQLAFAFMIGFMYNLIKNLRHLKIKHNIYTLTLESISTGIQTAIISALMFWILSKSGVKLPLLVNTFIVSAIALLISIKQRRYYDEKKPKKKCCHQIYRKDKPNIALTVNC